MNRILKARIIEKCGSQFAFATAVGEHETLISKVIHGKKTLTPEQRKKWAESLGVRNRKKLFGPEMEG